MINFVTFFVDPGPEKLDSYYAALYRVNLMILAESIHLNVPESRMILLTDNGTIVQNNLGLDQVRRCSGIDYFKLVTSRVWAQLKYLSSPAFSTDTVFLDTDIIVQRDPSEMFPPVGARKYDIGLTYRRKHEYHYPANLILVPKLRGQEGGKAKKFFEWWLSVTKEILETIETGDFLASQAALMQLGLTGNEGAFACRGWQFHIFPCEKYHWWPKGKKEYYGLLVEGVPFVHFKGE